MIPPIVAILAIAVVIACVPLLSVMAAAVALDLYTVARRQLEGRRGSL